MIMVAFFASLSSLEYQAGIRQAVLSGQRLKPGRRQFRPGSGIAITGGRTSVSSPDPFILS
jgi:hypothetical protein